MKGSGWLLDNLGLKLFALLLALLLYVHVLTDRTAEELVSFPLTLADLPDSLALATDPPPEVEVLLKGTGKQLLRLRYMRPEMKLSLAGVAVGTYQRTLVAGDVPLGDAQTVQVLEIHEPTQLSLEVTPRGERKLPVAANLVGDPARGFVVAAEPLIRPSMVRLSGPVEWVARQETLRTEPLSIAGKRDTIELVQPLSPPPGQSYAVPGSVLVSVPIEAEAVKQLTLDVEVRGIRSELRADARPASVSVTWRGPRSKAGGIDGATLRAHVDAGRRGRGEWMLPVEVTGEGATAVAVRPESVTVVLR